MVAVPVAGPMGMAGPGEGTWPAPGLRHIEEEHAEEEHAAGNAEELSPDEVAELGGRTGS